MEGKGKQIRMKMKMEKEVKKELSYNNDEDEHNESLSDDSQKKMKIMNGKKGFNCQADKCMADLNEAKPYHKRHKICEYHFKAQIVAVAGINQRFCQQCSRFHELNEFDDTKRSCRKRLAGHNQRRRKNNAAHESHSEGSTGTELKDLLFRKERIKISIQENPSYKHFQIRQS